MQTPFDLLRRDPDGSFIWLEAAGDLPLARVRRELSALASGLKDLSTRRREFSERQRFRYSILVDAATKFRVWSPKMPCASIALRVTKLR